MYITELIKNKEVKDYLKEFIDLLDKKLTNTKIDTLGLKNTTLLASAFEIYLVLERIKSKNASSSETIINDINNRISGLINSCNNQISKTKERLGHIRGTNSSFSLYIEGVESRFDILVRLLPKEMKHFEYKKYNGVDTDGILSDIMQELSRSKYKVNLNQYRSFIAHEF